MGAAERNLTAFMLGAVILLLCPPASSATTIHVTTTADTLSNDGECSLREAVIAANEDFPSGISAGECPAGSGTDSIILDAPGLYRFTRAGTGEDDADTGDLDLTESVTLEGGGAEDYIIDAGSLDRVFEITGSSLVVEIEGLTITGGNEPSRDGGGIYNDGDLTLTDVVISGNQADDDGGGIYHSGGLLTLTRTTFRNNQAGSFGDGGGLDHRDGTVSVVDCEFEGNSAYDGGGISVGSFTVLLTVTDSTFVSNFAGSDGGGINNDDEAIITGSTFAYNSAQDGGGISSSDTTTIRNVTFHMNTASNRGGGLDAAFGDIVLEHATFDQGDEIASSAIYSGTSISISNTLISGRCDGDPLSSSGGNIESPGNTCDLFDSSDQSGVSAALINLGPLGSHGGPTLTQVPRPGSILFESAADNQCAVLDQRGTSRPQDFDGNGGAQCDVGAVELAACGLSANVTISNEILGGNTTFEACESLEIGPNVEILDSGDVKLKSGDVVSLGDGFQVNDGGELEVETQWAFWDANP